MSEKRYYWLRFQADFFNDIRIKKLRKLNDGDNCLIIYLKLQTQSLNNNGIIKYQGLEDTFTKELALLLDEDESITDQTIEYLFKVGLAERNADNSITLPQVQENIGSISSSGIRMRKKRSNTVTDCNSDAQSDTEINKNKEDKDKEINIDIKTENIEKDPKLLEEQFNKWWDYYPIKFNKVECYKMFCKVSNNTCNSTDLIKAIYRQTKSKSGRNNYSDVFPEPITYLRQQLWERDVQDFPPLSRFPVLR